MAVDHDGNVQALAEVVEDDGGRSGVGAAVAGTHGARLVQQKTDGQLGDLVGQVVFVEDFSVIPMQSVGVQPPSHQQTGLLSAPPTVLELLKQALLELAGDLVMRAELEEQLVKFQGKFDNRYIDSLCMILLQAMESGQSVDLLGDLSEQIKDMEAAVLGQKKEALDRSVTFYQLGILVAVMGLVLYACVTQMFTAVTGF